MTIELKDIGYPIPKPPATPYGDWQPKWIFHFMLTCDGYARIPQMNNRYQLLLTSTEVKKIACNADPAIAETEAVTYAVDVAKGKKALGPYSRGATQFDMTIMNQCFVVIELDENIAWEYACGSRGITTKHNKPDHDFGVQIFDLNGNLLTSDVILEANDPHYTSCRVLMFRLRTRKVSPDHLRPFNIFVDILHQSRRLPTIFDPDIGNNGGMAIPP